MKTFPTYSLEEQAKKTKNCSYIAGVDEAGRGPGAGPVVAAAVRIPDAYLPTLVGKVNDSKKMSARRREEMYDMITRVCDYGIGVIDNRIIDEINILEATKLAMRKAVNDLKYVDYVLVDGTVDIKGLDVPQEQVIKGDAKSVSIAAASVLAKVARDYIMTELHFICPVYNWIKNKGYLTKEHIEMIRVYGVSDFHRRSFNKVGRDRNA
jgi:ribonuclease HII